MEVRCVKKAGGLFPFDQDSKMYLDKIKDGEYVEVEAKKKRNGKFHKKYFVMLRVVAEQLNCKLDDLHDFIKEKTGRYDIVSIGGVVRKSYHSISFSKMDGIEFACYYDESIVVVAELLGLDHKELLEELEAEYF